jgi:methionine synthase II (cobalamin-independent)
LFIVRDTFFAEAENRWLGVRYSMRYEQRPYRLTRAMYVPSVSARDFPSEETPGRDVVGTLREEIEEFQSEGVALIQLDEPVLTVNPRTSQVECSSAIGATLERMHPYAADNIWVNPDRGFGRFSDRPIATSEIAAAKLRAIVEAVAVHQAPRRA